MYLWWPNTTQKYIAFDRKILFHFIIYVLFSRYVKAFTCVPAMREFGRKLVSSKRQLFVMLNSGLC